ncbi:MAG TPA: cytochrome c biogenesis protein DipZ [Nitrospiria bacterium]|jgi:cytochrome c biogenesis protein CcdA/thiol-disulfide isomerase/thioredoxin|nr:cytochrome c biogenesis protein DipZ [Nitrospiria bacterium]
MNWALELFAILAGLLTVVSPCILPVLPPLLGASVATPVRHRPLWIVLGLASGFTFFGTTFALFGSFLGLSSSFLRQAALVVLFFFGLSLIRPRLWEGMGNRISSLAQRITGTGKLITEQGRLNAFLIGVSLGLIWAPCAGPILGIIITLATVQRSFTQTLVLMGGYSLGAAVPMLLIGYGGRRVTGRIQRFRAWGPISHKVLGFLTLVTVIGLYFNVDALVLSHLPGQLFIANWIEEKLVEKKDSVSPETDSKSGIALASTEAVPLPVLGTMPEFSQITAWINSPAMSSSGLREKVVLVDFWTYSCINCIRTLPYVTQWYEKYKDQGLVIVGVHTPEFSFEKEVSNIKQAVIRHGVHYPVAVDNDYGAWNAYNNRYWPAHYLIDARGRIRQEHFGEGNYEETEQAIQALLAEAKLLHKPVNLEAPKGSVDFSKIHSFETYIGYGRAQNFSSPQCLQRDAVLTYSAPTALGLNQWTLTGLWKITEEAAVLQASHGAIRFRFEAPKLNLVMAEEEKGSTAKVLLDGKPIPLDSRGDDVGPDGKVAISGSRLYNLVTLPPGDEADHLFELIFEKPKVRLFAFTFG